MLPIPTPVRNPVPAERECLQGTVPGEFALSRILLEQVSLRDLPAATP